ncbi:hypothetical protein X011_20660 [Mycobacterium tuberculosis variant microti OV254]|nr:hypothetical protein X011_20660 [Mycobacterium tuberculosis variant microti OV254]
MRAGGMFVTLAGPPSRHDQCGLEIDPMIRPYSRFVRRGKYLSAENC